LPAFRLSADTSSAAAFAAGFHCRFAPPFRQLSAAADYRHTDASFSPLPPLFHAACLPLMPPITLRLAMLIFFDSFDFAGFRRCYFIISGFSRFRRFHFIHFRHAASPY